MPTRAIAGISVGILGLCISAHAEIITLRDGQTLEGPIVKENANDVFIDLGYTVLTVPRNTIQKIEKEKPKSTDAATAPASEELRSDDLYSTRDLAEASVRQLSERFAGFSARRTLPQWRKDIFVDAAEPQAAGHGREVVLLADTFNRYFEPENLDAAVTVLRAAGYTVHFFPTGQGNVIGNPILPVIKLCANPRTVRTMSEHVDVDVSGILRREMTIPEAGDALIEMVVRTANGRLTAAEALGHREFVLTKLYRSA